MQLLLLLFLLLSVPPPTDKYLRKFLTMVTQKGEEIQFVSM